MRAFFVDAPHARWSIYKGTMPSPGFLQLAAYIEERGHQIRYIDCTVLDHPWGELEETIRQEKPDVIAITGSLTCFANDAMDAARLAKMIRPEVPVVVGGVHFTSTSEETLKNCKAIDFIVKGEGEETCAELFDALAKGTDNFEEIRGIAYRENGQYKETAPRSLIPDLDALPMPAYHLLTHMHRYRIIYTVPRHLQHRGFTANFSRGCGKHCTFCSESLFWQRTWRGRSARKIADEFELLWDKYGKMYYYVGDNCFNWDRNRIIQLADEIKKRRLPLKLWIQSRVDHILRDADLLPLFKEMGVVRIMLGIESPLKSRLEAYEKGVTEKQVKEAVRLIKKHGFVVMSCLIFGAWEDDKKSLKRTYKILKSYGDVLYPMLLTPFPGTKLYEEALRENRIKVKDYRKYTFLHAIMPTKTLTVKGVERTAGMHCVRFYWRPRTLVRALLSRNPWVRTDFRFLIPYTWDVVRNYGDHPKDPKYQSFQQYMAGKNAQSTNEYRRL